MKIKIFAFMALILPSLTFAARPFVTDDARLTTGGSCQLESWMRAYSDSKELWALPACNPTGNLEFTFGGGRAKQEALQATNDYVFQAKTLFRTLETNSWGWGLAVGTIRHPEIRPGPNMLGNTYAYIPLSVSQRDDKVITHFNLGLIRDKASASNSLSWGVGGEFKLQSKLLGIAETYGDNRGTSYGQVGVRYSVVPDLFQVDATLGKQLSGESNMSWVSFGIRYTPAKLF
jgi:hypothetical protein